MARQPQYSPAAPAASAVGTSLGDPAPGADRLAAHGDLAQREARAMLLRSAGNRAMPRMQDRLAVVTGAAHGLGEAIARRLAEEGARLALFDMDEAGLDRVAVILRGKGAHVVALPGDVTEKALVQQGLAPCYRKRGGEDSGGRSVLVGGVRQPRQVGAAAGGRHHHAGADGRGKAGDEQHRRRQ